MLQHPDVLDVGEAWACGGGVRRYPIELDYSAFWSPCSECRRILGMVAGVFPDLAIDLRHPLDRYGDAYITAEAAVRLVNA